MAVWRRARKPWMEMLQPHPISQLLDTFLKYFLELKLYIPYLVSKLGKSGVQRFKWYVIRRWNEEVMVVWRQARKAEREFRSWETTFWHTSAICSTVPLISKLQNEPRNQFWAAKSLLSFEMAAKSPPSLEMAFKLRNWLEKWRKVCKNTLQSQGKLLKCQ